ncbi:myoneurin-like [Trichogramma pretiosum]|uniref:myoneurin-like n=1 Tax=Trichogramma pretiosum TaxID=7493 RepID=UPI0006C9CBF9|nr:myoneurin-like [Trichogramma pretiosum]
MEPSDSYNCAIRVKEEHSYALLIENDSGIIDEKPDLKNLQLLLLPPESSNQTVRKCDEHRESELDIEVEITFECENLKPQMNLSVHEKIDDYSQSHLRNVKDSDGYKIQNAVRIEYVEEEKQTFFGDAEKSNLNFECELARLDKRRIIRKKLNNEHNLKTHVGTMNSDTTHACDVCVKTFSQSQHLKFHIDKVHHKITSTYDMCGKSFSLTGYVAHIDAVHNGVPHACHICGKNT